MNDILTCSYYCHHPACVKAQRDELRDKLYGPAFLSDKLQGMFMALHNKSEQDKRDAVISLCALLGIEDLHNDKSKVNQQPAG